MHKGFGKTGFGQTLHKKSENREDAREKAQGKIERWRDEARVKLWKMRKKYKRKVENNEEEMEEKKEQRRENLNPTARQTLPSRKHAQKVRKTCRWSAVPEKPKYSRAEPADRVYGRRFELKEKEKEKEEE